MPGKVPDGEIQVLSASVEEWREGQVQNLPTLGVKLRPAADRDGSGPDEPLSPNSVKKKKTQLITPEGEIVDDFSPKQRDKTRKKLGDESVGIVSNSVGPLGMAPNSVGQSSRSPPSSELLGLMRKPTINAKSKYAVDKDGGSSVSADNFGQFSEALSPKKNGKAAGGKGPPTFGETKTPPSQTSGMLLPEALSPYSPSLRKNVGAAPTSADPESSASEPLVSSGQLQVQDRQLWSSERTDVSVSGGGKDFQPEKSVMPGDLVLLGVDTRSENSVTEACGTLKEHYTIEQKLGEGAYGTVVAGRSNKTKKPCAVKSIPFEKLENLQDFEKELYVAKKLRHPYIVLLHEVFRGEREVHLVMELCTGGSFIDKITLTLKREYILQGRGPGLPVDMVAKYMWQMVAGIAYLHHNRIAHRDVKPENYLLRSGDDSADLVLIDFGFARRYTKGKPMTTRVGTVYYIAPEVLEGSYSEKCDVWSLGVVSYVAFCGCPPFDGETDPEIVQAVKKGNVTFEEMAWKRVPEPAKALIKELLTRDASTRPGAKMVVDQNAWLRKNGKPSQSTGCCSLS
eukprot:gnl/TRDRNA2_/TRDRNA2_202748_c0_seq1.p1 gnl/TRDRNA2_/TRDRNA2_202748_c0~~gnl/TRDRNA2_/TRDRNA2_202748_c0_seq1.p1  ORF type:complete len:568 (-),score=102.21 gnl/TRDRNA2_/TRDRNA2_202748_c0_seq1:133-1836(-)